MPTPGDSDRRAGADRPPHHRPRARSVIFLFMEGGPSQVDTFDPKPRLDREDGQPFKMKAEPTQFNNNGKTLGSPWKFRPAAPAALRSATCSRAFGFAWTTSP